VLSAVQARFESGDVVPPSTADYCRIAELLGPSQSKDIVRVSARACHNSGLLTDNFITKVASNGNLQIKMHGFTSQNLTQR
jgi:hypothetical protein